MNEWEYADIVIDTYSRDGVTGRFEFSSATDERRSVGFTFKGATGQLALTGVWSPQLRSEYGDSMRADAREAWMAHRDSLRDADTQTGGVLWSTMLKKAST